MIGIERGGQTIRSIESNQSHTKCARLRMFTVIHLANCPRNRQDRLVHGKSHVHVGPNMHAVFFNFCTTAEYSEPLNARAQTHSYKTPHKHACVYAMAQQNTTHTPAGRHDRQSVLAFQRACVRACAFQKTIKIFPFEPFGAVSFVDRRLRGTQTAPRTTSGRAAACGGVLQLTRTKCAPKKTRRGAHKRHNPSPSPCAHNRKLYTRMTMGEKKSTLST